MQLGSVGGQQKLCASESAGVCWLVLWSAKEKMLLLQATCSMARCCFKMLVLSCGRLSARQGPS
jgi:hypothetical protein